MSQILRSIRVRNSNEEPQRIRVRRSDGELIYEEWMMGGQRVEGKMFPSEWIWPCAPLGCIGFIFKERSDLVIELQKQENMLVEIEWK